MRLGERGALGNGAEAARALTAPPARGAAPSRLSIFLLDSSLIESSPYSVVPACALWHFLGVGPGLHHIPQAHHGVIFVHHVVAVDGVLAQPVPEAEEEQDALIGSQL